MKEKRETKKLWLVDVDQLFFGEVHAEETNNPGVWWIPSKGYSATENYNLFELKGDAISSAIRRITDMQFKQNLFLNRVRSG